MKFILEMQDSPEDAQTFLKDGVSIYTILRASISHNDASSRLFVNEELFLWHSFLLSTMLIHISGPGPRSQNSLLPSIFGAEQFLPLNIYGSPGPHVSMSYPSCFLWQENDQAANSYTSWLTELKSCDDFWLNICCRVSSLNLSNRSGSVFASIWYFFSRAQRL